MTLICGGSLRGDSVYGPGPLTLRAVLEVLPFEDATVVLELTGQQICACTGAQDARDRSDQADCETLPQGTRWKMASPHTHDKKVASLKSQAATSSGTRPSLPGRASCP